MTAITRIDVTVHGDQAIADHMQPEWASIRFFANPPVDVTGPDGSVIEGTRAMAAGPTTAPTQYHTHGGRLWGIGLLPLGWARLMQVDASDIANTVVDAAAHPAWSRFAPLADMLFRDGADDEQEYRLIVQHLRSLHRPHRDTDRIVQAHRALVDHATVNVAEFAAKLDLSKRTLERLCNKHFGFPPAVLLRRQRLMRSLMDYMLSTDRKWSEVIDGSYHDQAHFVREFHSFMGMSPRDYAALDTPILDALIRQRSELKGAATQTLEGPDG
ncbi:helix-turn-helix domain-containing protein [Parerythrobacter jejuensis]|uniref:Helix-turn-helix domain-containing protein n=1 Tax=Parerythrobacter jejuensis TaxID=795812 RepID=A0A845APJ1_9SPHN|nr:AraC family transcriptional regulator [Parerythrobacter jejuensis]MXP30791.1 helix-turn-helix domain-containing protein [Parerythrobacter jejuensis]MXP33551.1 helix-turn-helix domain-containing protein [Parerythrobacter jejuensis]